MEYRTAVCTDNALIYRVVAPEYSTARSLLIRGNRRWRRALRLVHPRVADILTGAHEGGALHDALVGMRVNVAVTEEPGFRLDRPEPGRGGLKAVSAV